MEVAGGSRAEGEERARRAGRPRTWSRATTRRLRRRTGTPRRPNRRPARVIERSDACGQMLGQPEIVAVEEREEVTRRMIDPGVARAVRAAIFLLHVLQRWRDTILEGLTTTAAVSSVLPSSTTISSQSRKGCCRIEAKASGRKRSAVERRQDDADMRHAHAMPRKSYDTAVTELVVVHGSASPSPACASSSDQQPRSWKHVPDAGRLGRLAAGSGGRARGDGRRRRPAVGRAPRREGPASVHPIRVFFEARRPLAFLWRDVRGWSARIRGTASNSCT